jgi:hypothetical protein
MSRPLVLSAFLAAWFVTGIVAGVVMARRRDRFPWWLLGVAFGALIVPLAFVAEHVEQPTGRVSSRLTSPDQPAPIVVAINHSPEAVAVLAAGLDGRRRKAG